MAHTVTQHALEPILSTVYHLICILFRILCLLKYLKNKSCHHCFTFLRHFTISALLLLVSPINLSGVSTSHLLGQTWRRETKCSEAQTLKVLCFQMGIFGSIGPQLRYSSAVLWDESAPSFSCLSHTLFTHFTSYSFFKTVPNPATELDGKWVDGFYLKMLLTQQMHLSLKKNANCLTPRNSLIGRAAHEKWKSSCRGKKTPSG